MPGGPLTATGTFVRAMFSRTRVPAVSGVLAVVQEVKMATGVLVKELSKTMMEPVSTLPLPAVMSMPTPQLLMERPE